MPKPCPNAQTPSSAKQTPPLQRDSRQVRSRCRPSYLLPPLHMLYPRDPGLQSTHSGLQHGILGLPWPLCSTLAPCTLHNLACMSGLALTPSHACTLSLFTLFAQQGPSQTQTLVRANWGRLADACPGEAGKKKHLLSVFGLACAGSAIVQEPVSHHTQE